METTISSNNFTLQSTESVFNYTNITEEMVSGNSETLDQTTIMWLVLDSIIASLGIMGNGMVIFVFIRMVSLQNLVNLFIINQSLIDFTSSLVFMIVRFQQLLGKTVALTPGNQLDRFICKFWVSEYCMWALFIASTFNLMNITLERYFAIMKPQAYRFAVGAVRKRMILVAILTWVLGFLPDCTWAYMHDITAPDVCALSWKSKYSRVVAGMVVFTVTFLAPLFLMTFAYFQIIRQLRRNARRVGQNEFVHSVELAENSSGNRNNHPSQVVDVKSKVNRNIIKTMVTVSTVYGLCWAPSAFTYFLYNLDLISINWDGPWDAVCEITVSCNMLVNPFIYTMQYKQFQEGLKKVFGIASTNDNDRATQRTSRRTDTTNTN